MPDAVRQRLEQARMLRTVGAAPRREPGGVGFESFAPRRGSYAKMPSRKL